jgi:hypothetical protein
MINKDLCDCRNVSVKLPSIYVCLSSADLLIFQHEFPLSFLFLIINNFKDDFLYLYPCAKQIQTVSTFIKMNKVHISWSLYTS